VLCILSAVFQLRALLYAVVILNKDYLIKNIYGRMVANSCQPSPNLHNTTRGDVVLSQHNFSVEVDIEVRYGTRCYFNVRSKADMSQFNLPHGTDN